MFQNEIGAETLTALKAVIKSLRNTSFRICTSREAGQPIGEGKSREGCRELQSLNLKDSDPIIFLLQVADDDAEKNFYPR